MVDNVFCLKRGIMGARVHLYGYENDLAPEVVV